MASIDNETNLTTNSSQGNPLDTSTKEPLSFMAFFWSMRVLWLLLTLFGNSLTLVVIKRFENLHTCSNYLICSLSAADMIGSSSIIFYFVHYFIKTPAVNINACLAEQVMHLYSTGVNLSTMAWIAIDRFIFISFPLRYHAIVTGRRTAILILGTWIYVVSTASGILFGLNNYQVGDACRYHSFLNRLVYIYYVTPYGYTFMVTTVIFYVIIAVIAYKQKRKIAAMNAIQNAPEIAANRKQNQILKMMLLVFGVFFVSNVSQLTVVVVMRVAGAPPTIVQYVEKITYLMFWCNTWLNPFIYAWKGKDFREAFKKQLRCN